MSWIDRLFENPDIVEHHLHPDLSVTTPNGRLRVGAISFDTAADSETVTVGYIAPAPAPYEVIYTFQDTLVAPIATKNVSVKVQGSVELTVAKLAQAITGVVDAPNIAYFGTEGVHPDIRVSYTGCRVSVGTDSVPAIHGATATDTVRVPTIVFLTKVGDRKGSVYPITLADTTTHAGVYLLTAFDRISTARYLLTGNDALGGAESIAGPLQCICPMDSVVHPTEYVPVMYDVTKIAVDMDSLAGEVIECDGYWSLDEVTFTPMWYGLELSREIATIGSQQFLISGQRIPAGAGFYVKIRSNGTDTADYIDFKVQYHVYPTELSE